MKLDDFKFGDIIVLDLPNPEIYLVEKDLSATLCQESNSNLYECDIKTIDKFRYATSDEVRSAITYLFSIGRVFQSNYDAVSNPKYYTEKKSDIKIECMDAIVAAFGYAEAAIFCKINAFKYNWRLGNKNDNDVDKGIWYLNKYKELMEKLKIFKKNNNI